MFITESHNCNRFKTSLANFSHLWMLAVFSEDSCRPDTTWWDAVKLIPMITWWSDSLGGPIWTCLKLTNDTLLHPHTLFLHSVHLLSPSAVLTSSSHANGKYAITCQLLFMNVLFCWILLSQKSFSMSGNFSKMLITLLKSMSMVGESWMSRPQNKLALKPSVLHDPRKSAMNCLVMDRWARSKR